MATRKQGGLKAESLKFNLDGLGFILGREISFSVVFWTCNEYFFKQLHHYTGKVAATTFAALISGIAGGIASYPMDALRTWKINFPEKFQNKSAWAVVKEI